MGFLTKAASGEDQDGGSDGNEELYKELFPKIGRDFISRGDFVQIMQRIMGILDPGGFSPINFEQDSEARRLAQEYKSILDSGKNDENQYEDLIDLED